MQIVSLFTNQLFHMCQHICIQINHSSLFLQMIRSCYRTIILWVRDFLQTVYVVQ